MDQIQVRTMSLEYAVRALSAKPDLADNYLDLACKIHAFLTNGPGPVETGMVPKSPQVDISGLSG